MGMRPAATHSRCDDCAKYSKYRTVAENEAMMKAVTAAYTRHIRDVLCDRHIICGMEAKAELAARNESAQVPHLILTIDAMDKAKWMIPRQLENSKRLAALWRPSLHFVGVLIAGVLEYFAIMEPDSKGDSDCQQTLIARALEHAEDVLRGKNKEMPRRLVIHSDNTAKEGRNSPMVTFASALVAQNKFCEVSLALFRVGHTHNRLDQRFGVLAAKLSRASCLETPADYVAFVQENYQPARGVKLIVEEVHAIHHWREFFAPLNVHFKGMQGSRTTADAAHVLRIVRRDALALTLPGFKCQDAEEITSAGRGSDPVLLAKHWLCSKTLGQPPTVLLEGPLPVDSGDLTKLVAPRTLLNEDSVKKYKKTAEEILSDPWKLESSYAYLLGWVKRNQSLEQGPLPEISFLTSPHDHGQVSADLNEEVTWKDFVPDGAVQITPVAKFKAAKPQLPMKRPAAAEQSADDTPGGPPQLAHLSRAVRARANVQAALAADPLFNEQAGVNPVQIEEEVQGDANMDLVAAELPSESETVVDPVPASLAAPPESPKVFRKPAAAVLRRPAAAPKGVAKAKAKPAAAAAAAPGVFLHYGCCKCRYGKLGCPSRCHKMARDNIKGYSFDSDNNVVRHAV
jgi:hypothetical protein